MNKRDFLKTSGILLTGAAVSRYISAEQSPEITGPRTNWAGNLTYSTDNLYEPKSAEEVRQIVQHAAKLRALGARHSFNAIADSTAQPDLARTSRPDRHRRQSPHRHRRRGHQATASSRPSSMPAATRCTISPRCRTSPSSAPCSTATHGSGIHNGNLATAVSALEFVHCRRRSRHLSRAKDGEQFLGAVVAPRRARHSHPRHTQPAAHIPGRAVRLPESLLRSTPAHLDDIFGSGYSVSLFTDWQNHRATQVWIKRRRQGRRAPTTGRRYSTAPSSPPKSCTPSTATPPKPAPSSKASPVPGTSACRTSR